MPHAIPALSWSSHALRVLRKFAIHVFVGTAIFVLIATPAVVLDVLITWLTRRDVSVWLLYTVRAIEILLFVLDVLLFGVFLVRSATKAFREL